MRLFDFFQGHVGQSVLLGCFSYLNHSPIPSVRIIRRFRQRHPEALKGNIIPVLNDEIIAEYEDVLKRPKFRFDAKTVKVFLEELKKRAVYTGYGMIEDEIPDPKDFVFYAVLMEKRNSRRYIK